MVQRIPQKLISQVLVVLLVVLTGWLLARLSWLMIPQPEADSWQPQLGGSSSATASAPDVQRLLSFSLFGKAEAQAETAPEPVVTEAPKTRLNVKLTGLVSGLDPAMGSAVIESRGSEFGYALAHL